MHLFPDRFFLHDQLTMTIVDFFLIFFYPYSVVDWTDINWKCHELSGKSVYGLCGDRSELALPPLRASTWMSVECEENVFYHTAAPPPIALTSSSDENVTAAGTLQSWTSIKMGIRSERQCRQSTFSSQPSRCLIITRPPISLSPLIDCSYFGFFHANQILRTPFFFLRHISEPRLPGFNSFQLVSGCCLQHLTFKDNMFSFCYSAHTTTALRKKTHCCDIMVEWHLGVTRRFIESHLQLLSMSFLTKMMHLGIMVPSGFAGP